MCAGGNEGTDIAMAPSVGFWEKWASISVVTEKGLYPQL